MPTFSTRRHTASSETPSATRRAYEALKHDILTCRRPPGSDLYEAEIAESLEVSRTPVREALGMLVHEGFVHVRPRQGYRVTDVTISDVQEVFQLRMLLEPAAAELAAERATPEQLRSLRELIEARPSTFADQVALEMEFHQILADASGNERLASTLTRLYEELHRFLFMGLGLESEIVGNTEEHRQLFDALLKGNHHLARGISERQVEEGRLKVFESILETLSSSPEQGSSIILTPRTVPPDDAD